MKRLAAFICMIVLAGGIASLPGQAFADGQTDDAEGVDHHVYLIIAPDLTWADIDEANTPTLLSIAGHYGAANVVNTGKHTWAGLEDDPRFVYQRINDATPTEIDRYVYGIYSTMQPGDSLVITSSPSLAKAQFNAEGYSLLIMRDAGDNGLLKSTTTTRSGLVLADDVDKAVRSLVESPQINPANISVFPFSNFVGSEDRVNQLFHDSSVAVSIADSKPLFTYVFIAWMAITFLFSLLLLFLEIKIRPRFMEYLLPATRILWIVALAFPLATYVMALQLPSVTTPELAIDFFAFVVMEISFIALTIALMFRWIHSLLFLLVAGIVALVFDQLSGGMLSGSGYLSYSPLDQVRYFGISNEGAAVLFGSWIVFSGLALNRAGDRKWADHFRTWMFPLISACIVTVMAAPWWGANFGSIVWGSVGILTAWALFNKVKLTWKIVVGAIAFAVAAGCAVLFLDATFNIESHMGGQLNILSGNVFAQLVQIVYDMLRLSWATLVFSPPLTVMFFIIVAFLVFIRVKKPGGYGEFWTDNTAFKGAYTACLISAIMMLFIEDSGILMPAVLLLYPMAGLLWLICDRHSWHIRRWLEHRTHMEVSSFVGDDPAEDGTPLTEG